MWKPYVIMSVAMSLDGHIDDRSNERLILSNEEDFDEIDELRASCDAIIVGAGTIRKDDPRLEVRSEARIKARREAGKSDQPIKVMMTSMGKIPKERRFFEGDSRKIVYCGNSCERSLLLPGGAEMKPQSTHNPSPHDVLSSLAFQGVERVLIEAGEVLAGVFLKADLVDEYRTAIAPFFVGDPRAPRLLYTENGLPHNVNRPMRLKECRQLGQMAVLTWILGGKDES